MRCDQDQSGEGCRYEQSRCEDRIRGLCSFISSFQGDQSTKTNEPCGGESWEMLTSNPARDH